MPRLLVRTQPLGAGWKPLSTDVRRGVYIEDFQCSADLWGPLDASFTLKRSPRTSWPDIGFWAPMEVEIENQLVWSGRILQTPGSDADGDTVTVTAQGWQSHLDDRPFSKLYATNSLASWLDVRSNQNATLTTWTAGTQVSNDQTGLTLTLPNGTVRPANTGNGAFIDLGPANTSARVVVQWAHSNNEANTGCILYASNTIAGLSSPSAFATVVPHLNATATGTAGFTIGPYRYLLLGMVDVAGAPLTPGADVWIRFPSIQVFTSTAYESANASILKASDVALDVFNRLPSIPTALIGTTSFPIPALAMAQQTPRDAVNAFNSYQDWQARVRADLVFEYRAKPLTAALALTDQSAFDDLSAGSGDQIYNEVTYQGTGPDGIAILVTRTAAAAGLPLTIPDRRGGTRGFTIQSAATLTATAAQQLCDVFLSQHNTTPFRGTVHATSRRSVAIHPSGTPCPPWHLLRMTGELCTFKHLQNPDTGALGRDGRIAKTTYTHSSDSAEVDIDSTSGSFEALAARLAVVTAR